MDTVATGLLRANARTMRSKIALAALAISGVIAYQILLVGPFAAILLLNPWVHYLGVWPIVAVLLFIWWTLQPNHAIRGEPLSRDEAPALFDTIEELADRLAAPRVDEVRLVEDFNAAALEAKVRWQPWRKRRVLILGVPLLALVGTDTIRGVIAHELGHFSHRHGRLGHWIYRSRAGWLEYAESTTGSVTVFERGVAAFAGWFAPRFSRMSFGYARDCEFEADAYGAAVVGKLNMASALMTIEAFDDRWRRMAKEALPRLVALQDMPPASWMAEVQREVLVKQPTVVEWEDLRGRVSREDDTHPSLGERIQALGVSGQDVLQASTLPDRVAGAAWFQEWDTVIARHDKQWSELHAGGWRREHIRQRHQRHRLDELRKVQGATIERARLELEYGKPATVIELARPWLDDPIHAGEAAYLHGAAQLSRGDKAGIATLESGVQRDPSWAAPARALIERHADLLADAAHRRRNKALLDRARERRARALDQVEHGILSGTLKAARLDDVSWAVLRDALLHVPSVAAAWCAGEEDVIQGDRRFCAVILILRLHTERMHAAGLSEDDIRSDSRSLLGTLLPDATLKLVWTAFTTEPLPAELDLRLAEWARSGDRACLVTPKPDEAVGPGVRASALG